MLLYEIFNFSKARFYAILFLMIPYDIQINANWIFKYNFLKNGINSRFFIGVQLQIIEKGAEKGQML
jgi:hypothetical protein|nr:MAG TPA: hypothetical protein [Caudoviricetes sp.]